MSIETLQKYWLTYMYSQHDIQKIFVSAPEWKIEMYLTREDGVVKLRTVHV